MSDLYDLFGERRKALEFFRHGGVIKFDEEFDFDFDYGVLNINQIRRNKMANNKRKVPVYADHLQIGTLESTPNTTHVTFDSSKLSKENLNALFPTDGEWTTENQETTEYACTSCFRKAWIKMPFYRPNPISFPCCAQDCTNGRFVKFEPKNPMPEDIKAFTSTMEYLGLVVDDKFWYRYHTEKVFYMLVTTAHYIDVGRS